MNMMSIGRNKEEDNGLVFRGSTIEQAREMNDMIKVKIFGNSATTIKFIANISGNTIQDVVEKLVSYAIDNCRIEFMSGVMANISDLVNDRGGRN